MTQHDAAREHALHDDGSGEPAIHARIARALAALGENPDGAPPPPYARRHLARHAQRGGVLDDARVPPQALAWDTGGGIRGLLHASAPSGPRHWLTAWSVVEPYLHNADLPSRLCSLQLAHTAMHHPRTPRSRLPGDEAATLGDGPLTAVWADWQAASNVLATLPAPAVSLTVLPPSGSGGPHLAAGTTDGSIHFLDLHTTQFAATQAAHTGEVRRLHVTDPDPEGFQYLISASTDGTLRLWDACHHTHLDHLAGTTWIDDTTSFYDEDSRLTVLSVNGRSELIQWSPPAPHRLRHTEQPVVHGAVATLIGEHGERHIVHATHQLTLHTGGTGGTTHHPLTVPARALTVGREPGRFYCGHADGTITTWSTTRGQLADSTPGHGEPVKDLITFTLDGREIVAAAHGSSILLWDPATHTTGQLTGHRASVTALTALATDPQRHTPDTLISAATDATLLQWPADLLRHALAAGTTARPARPAAAPLLHANTTPLAACPAPTGIDVWDLQLGTNTAVPADAPVLAVTWTQRAGQPALLLWSDTTHTIRGWDPVTGNTTTLIPDSEARTTIMAACHTPQGLALLLAAGDDYRTRLWDLNTTTLLRTWRQPRSIKAAAAAASEDGQLWLATGGTDGIVRLWDPQQPEHCRAELRCDQGLISALALHPEPTDSLPPFLATGGDQAPVRLWDLNTYAPLEQALDGASAPIDALTAFSSGQHAYVAAAARDGLVRIWHAGSAHCILTLATGAPVTRLDAHPQPDGHNVLLSLSGDAGILVAQLDLGHRTLTH